MQVPWLVVKLGGTSVSRREYWDNVVKRLNGALEDGLRVVIVHSALAGVTNLLEGLAGSLDQRNQAGILADITARHEALAQELGIGIPDAFRHRLGEVEALLAAGPAASPDRRARVLGSGEFLMSTLAQPFLESRGLSVDAIDVRTLLHARAQPGQHPSRHYLSANCDHAPDSDVVRRLRKCAPVVLTQGFVASDAEGATVVLGRGGSDTSAACLAAKIGAAALEIWTDVPGLFTADPHRLPTARLLKQLTYDEALEIAAAGARALHPHCIRPLREACIPLTIRYTPRPELPGTHIHARAVEPDGRLKAVCSRLGITTLTLETADMWQQAGFLADVFACFKRHHLSVDMISTSETSITLTLDAADNPLAGERIAAVQAELAAFGAVGKTENCAAISLVGHRIRANLHRIAPLLEIFADHRVHLVCQASNDLNVTFVVDESDAPRLVSQLHALLVSAASEDTAFGPAWNALCSPPAATAPAPPWWRNRRSGLVDLATEHGPCYVYDSETVRNRANALKALTAPRRIFYAIKANCHPGILRIIHDSGIGFECVSFQEVDHVLTLFPDISRQRILFTPNFAPCEEYAKALAEGVWTTLDNLYPLRAWPELFRGHALLLRVDLGAGAGHHKHVRTGGNESKFGIPVRELDEARELAAKRDIRVVGLHTHAGSGIKDPAHWRTTGLQLAHAAAAFENLEFLDLGGGLGVPEHGGDPALDLASLDAGLAEVAAVLPGTELWLEPGRYLVSEAGVLLTRVTQLKTKGATRFLGVDTGMNSLLRPALYGAYHPITNLSRGAAGTTASYNVVGPICETGDVLGTERDLPETAEGDILLVANVGAYGHVMSSRYNLREPAREIMLAPEPGSAAHVNLQD